MSPLGIVGPGFAVMVAVVVAALPWGLTGDARLVLPLLPYVLVHLTVERRAEAMPDWLAFAAGFALDVAGQGPLGYWALVYLAGFTVVRWVTARGHLGLVSGISLFALTAAWLALVQWIAGSIYYLRPQEPEPLALAAGIAALAYAAAAVLVPARRPPRVHGNDQLARGA